MLINVSTTGTLKFIHSDSMQSLVDLDPRPFSHKVRRASHVEPSDGGWTADLSPVGGPVLGPYRERKDALAAEVDWIERNVL